MSTDLADLVAELREKVKQFEQTPNNDCAFCDPAESTAAVEMRGAADDLMDALERLGVLDA